ncbi:uridine kinase [Stackebrandtia albiflava]|uniref:Uridine kinase n=1 Tax=Stackebrandtia albiflava TaxID=406432 RepID=A0A562VDU4_9ACTN|nr:uridine kinase [Stackebrandtia albiflava]TWJ16059.1 uridine kinase [Stackebrandtia albiflava]
MTRWSTGRLVAGLHALIDRTEPADRPSVVGVTGIDTSGKSCLAAALTTRLRAAGRRVQPIHVDDFHRPRAERHHPELPGPEELYRFGIDHDRLRRELLEPIRHRGGVDARLILLDHYTDTWGLDRTYHVDAATVVLVEGIFLLRPELRPYIDLMVFLHVDEATALERAAARDVPLLGAEVLERYRRKYLPGQRAHLAAHPPEDHADVIVDNRDHAFPKVLKWPGRPPDDVRP